MISTNQSAISSALFVCLTHPRWRRRNLGSRFVAGVFSAAACQTTDGPNRHVTVAHDLTAQSNARQPPCRQHVTLGDRHSIGFAFNKFDATRRAPCIPAARMELIDPRVLRQRQNQSFSLRHFALSRSLDCQLRHEFFLL
jgi:hypothetical protein